MQLVEAMNSPDSVRANFRAGQILKAYALSTTSEQEQARYRKMAAEYYRKIDELEPDNATGKMAIVQAYLQTGETPPPALIEKLILELASTRFNIAMLGMFESYKDCLNSGGCPLEARDFERMLVAISINDDVLGYYKRTILVNYAKYLAEYVGDVNSAIIILLEALNVYSIKEDLVLLSSYYERIGSYTDMERTLDLLEENDRFGVFRSYTGAARERLGARTDEH